MQDNESKVSDLRDALLDGAECRFDPELHDGPDPLTTIEHPEARAAREDVARYVCAECPLQPSCLEYALGVLPRRGMWAGHTADEIAVLATIERRQVA